MDGFGLSERHDAAHDYCRDLELAKKTPALLPPPLILMVTLRSNSQSMNLSYLAYVLEPNASRATWANNSLHPYSRLPITSLPPSRVPSSFDLDSQGPCVPISVSAGGTMPDMVMSGASFEDMSVIDE